jgi:hypothetical protein
MATGGFSEIARLLTEHYELPEGEEITRQQVYQWWKRETQNAAGRPFPRELYFDPDAITNRPNRFFDLDSVIAWADAGIPADPHDSELWDKEAVSQPGWRYLRLTA